jgi:hypothetical protein
MLDSAYVAGFIDGEGCLMIQRTSLIISVAQCKRDVLDRLATQYGGRVYVQHAATEKWRSAWQWQVYNRLAYDILTEIRPHLLVKSDEADHCIKFWEAVDRISNAQVYKAQLQQLRKAA